LVCFISICSVSSVLLSYFFIGGGDFVLCGWVEFCLMLWYSIIDDCFCEILS
jgi:hypothetical protein